MPSLADELAAAAALPTTARGEIGRYPRGASALLACIYHLHPIPAAQSSPAEMPLNILSPTPPDIEIAQAVECRPIKEIAEKLGLDEDDYEPHGHEKAKVWIAQLLH